MMFEHWFLHFEASVIAKYKSTFRDACAVVQEHSSRHQPDWAYSASFIQIKIKYIYHNNITFAKVLVKLIAHVLIQKAQKLYINTQKDKITCKNQ